VLVEVAFFEQRLSWYVGLGSAILFAGIVLASPSKSPSSEASDTSPLRPREDERS